MSRPSLTPLFPVPRLVERPWGGSALKAWGRNCLDGTLIGESWEIGAVDGFDSPLEGGSFSMLSEAVHLENGGWLGCPAGGFPLLLKLIDARETLSLQVHPSETKGTARAKNEAWVVLDAPKDAYLYAGTATSLPSIELLARLEAGDVSCLQRIPVKAGDVVVIPAGTVHAITAGLLVFEVQQASDTTYRIHDWGRLGLDGKPRELHLEESAASIDPRPNSGLKPVPVSIDSGREILCATPWFAIRRLRPGKSEQIDTRDRFMVLMVVEGPVELSWQGGRKILDRGRTVLLPRGIQVQVAGGLLLEIWEPDWDRDVLGPVLTSGHGRQAAYQLSAGTVAR